MEARRRTRVFCLLHEANMQSDSVDELSSVEILKFLAKVEPDQDIDLIMHTGGGLITAGYQIARALKSHRGRVTVFVPCFAYSAGTIISLAADEIVMSPDAVLGPIDSQLSQKPISGYLSLLRYKPASRIQADNLAIALEYSAISEADHGDRVALMLPRYRRSIADRIVRRLNDGALTHGYPVSFAEASQLGLRVSSDMPDEPMDIIEYFRNRRGAFCSVIHCGEA
jgi:ClpP class serine protease